jgi:hypothetical protein
MLIIRTNTNRAPEKNYIFQVLFEVFLGIEYRVEWRPELTYFELDTNAGKCIRMPDCFSLEPTPANTTKHTVNQIFTPPNILAENLWMAHPFEPDVQLPVICGSAQFSVSEQGFNCGIDLFSASFFMLSRWEECLETQRDEHGRFPAQASLAYRNGFLQRPVVNEYLDFLWEMLLRCGCAQTRKTRTFQIVPTHDVDHPLLWWSPADRMRTLAGSLLKRTNFREFNFWLRNIARDPFNTFDWLMQVSESAGLKSCFNFMGPRARNSDAYYPFEHPFVQKLIEKIRTRGHDIGIHPSYESNEQPGLLQTELKAVQAAAAPLTVSGGRQHYLRFEVPNTWQNWSAAGLKWDSSMGYPEQCGFRCGVCYPFPVFDVQRRVKLNLWEKPLIAMDVTLALYQKLTPRAALEVLTDLVNTVRKHDGEFVLLWHNSSLNDYFWQPWKEVYWQTIRQ